ncbi:hypothetical protein COL52_03125 [Bacillus toyonensis]|uniref:Uncharacterized protein n=1 Tax=Bacillus toyonensis TaxID=155322 RepID=A0A2B5WIH3_9BACI|nr:hypothetical protein CN688_11365 [Bacillus toyonensis]PEL20705.1 hypothetical protein CN624_26950 [Bacillus toyonensis]PFY64930.1 hypothetical protein COL52_03125 [Bacillus toyonensis]PGA83885.1 hypothetical protein COL90_03095 [Bacillus toyonensis]PGG89742.1 hypothetical protein CON73_17500 [Bacillus toyonensis]
MSDMQEEFYREGFKQGVNFILSMKNRAKRRCPLQWVSPFLTLHLSISFCFWLSRLFQLL